MCLAAADPDIVIGGGKRNNKSGLSSSYRSLQMMVPSISNRSEVENLVVVLEAIKYIKILRYELERRRMRQRRRRRSRLIGSTS